MLVNTDRWKYFMNTTLRQAVDVARAEDINACIASGTYNHFPDMLAPTSAALYLKMNIPWAHKKMISAIRHNSDFVFILPGKVLIFDPGDTCLLCSAKAS